MMKKKNGTYWRKKSIELAKTKAKERDGYICQKCGKDRSTGQIHASHDVSVGCAIWLAADIRNITTLCYTHHNNWWHKNDIDCWEWHKSKFPERYKWIKENRYKQQKMNWEEVYKHLTKL
jgi:hypothetical protein